MDCGGIELQPNDVLIEMRGITKHFGSVVANENVNLTVRRAKSSVCWVKTAAAKRR